MLSALLIWVASASAQQEGSPGVVEPPALIQCEGHDHLHGVADFTRVAKRAYSPGRWQHANPVKHSERQAMRHFRHCAEGDAARAEMRRTAKRERSQFVAYRKLQLVTPFGKWAIPGSIVMCESGGDFGAYNSSYEPGGAGSGPGGAYQIILSTWRAYGGTGVPRYAPPLEQHQVAHRIWNAEGGSAWACA